MTEQAEQLICIRFCIKLEHSSTETMQMIQEAVAMGNWWGAASSRQCTCSCITSRAVFWRNIKSPRWLSPLQPRFEALQLLAFPKTKISFEREEISDHRWDSGKYDRELMAIRRTVWGPKVPTVKGSEMSLSYVQCFLYLVPSSVNVSIFHSVWMDTFWTGLVLNSLY